jgi:hypothetical protein
MNCNVHGFYILIFSNNFGFILETIFSYKLKVQAWMAWFEMEKEELEIGD